MFKLKIPNKYIKMFEIFELDEITITIDGELYKFSKKLLTEAQIDCEHKSLFYPDSWYEEIPAHQEDDVNILLNGFEKNSKNAAIIRKSDTTTVVVIKYQGGFIEVDRNISKSICDLKAYFQHLNNHYSLQWYLFCELSLDNHILFSEVYRYFIYPKNWHLINGSSGGGNITSAITEDELKERLLSIHTYDRVGVVNYRLTKQFINEIEQSI